MSNATDEIQEAIHGALAQWFKGINPHAREALGEFERNALTGLVLHLVTVTVSGKGPIPGLTGLEEISFHKRVLEFVKSVTADEQGGAG